MEAERTASAAGADARNETDSAALAPRGFTIATIQRIREVRIRFTIPMIQQDGVPIPFVHAFRPTLGDKVVEMMERVDRAGRGLKDEARDIAKYVELFACWEANVERVEGYGPVDALRGPALVEFFRNPPIPSDADSSDAERFKDVLKRGVVLGTTNFFRVHGGQSGETETA